MNNPSRPDLAVMAYRRHMDEVKSIITFLGSFTSYDQISEEINDHLNSLM